MYAMAFCVHRRRLCHGGTVVTKGLTGRNTGEPDSRWRQVAVLIADVAGLAPLVGGLGETRPLNRPGPCRTR